jgi:copper transport protein
VSVAFWVGALLPLAEALRGGDGRSELERFSKAIPLPLLVLVASGLVLAVIQVRQVEALWTTSYGVILCCKLLAICLLLGLAGVNRWLTPRAATGEARSMRLLGNSILVEFAIVIVILGLVASWRFTPPPRSLLAAASRAVHAHIHTDSVMADLQIESAEHGSRRMVVALFDAQSSPLPAKEVTLILSRPDFGIEPLRLPANHVDPAIWEIDGIRLPISGRWRVRIEILISDFDKIAVEDEVDLVN